MNHKLYRPARGAGAVLLSGWLCSCSLADKLQLAEPKANLFTPGEGLEPSAQAGYHYSAASLLEVEGDRDGAAAELEKALQYDPTSAYLKMRLAQYRLEQGKTQEAEALARSAVELEPNSARPLTLLAMIYLSSGRAREAQEILQKAVALDPEDEAAVMQLSMALINQGMAEPAVGMMLAFLQRHPDSVGAHYYLGQLYFQLNRFAEAAREYEETLRLQPAHYYALQELAQSKMLMRDKAGGAEIFARLLAYYPGDSTVRGILASTLMELQRWDEALAVLAQGKLEDESNPEWWLESGYLYLRRENLDAAEKEFRELLERDAQNDGALFYLGFIAEARKQPEQAREWYQKVPDESSRAADAQRRIAWLLEQGGHRDQALALLAELSRKKPEVAQFYLDRAALYQMDGKLDLALGVLDEGIGRVSDNLELLYQAGAVYDAMGERDLAVAQMEKILARHPGDARALNFIGYSYADRGIKLDEAEKLIRQALELEPGNGAIIDSLGWVFYQRRQYDEALKWLEQAIGQKAGDPEILEHLGDVWCAKGNAKKAADFYRRAAEGLEKAANNPRPELAARLKTKLEKPTCP